MRRRNKVIDRTYRISPMWKYTAFTAVAALPGNRVVFYGEDNKFHYAQLVSLDAKNDLFVVRYRSKGIRATHKGIWRVHDAELFHGDDNPKPNRRNRVFTSRMRSATLDTPQFNQPKGGHSMATVKTTRSKSATKAATSAKSAASNGSGRGRKSKIDELTDAQREKLANRVIKLRAQGIPWDGEEGICAREELITSAGVGRNLLRKYGQEGMIREQVRSGNVQTAKPAAKAKAKPVAKGKAKPAAKGKVVVRGKGKARPTS